jgi:sugar phosphate isomerase/epimerase
MHLGISSYTYNWAIGVPGFPQPAQPLHAAGLLAKAHEHDVSIVQIADNLPLDRLAPHELQHVAALAAELEIDIEVGASGISPARLESYLQLAVQLRSSLLRTVIDTDSHHPTPEEVVATLREVLPHFERANVCLAIENHDRFPAATLDGIIQQLGSAHLGICLDTANSLGCGEDLRTVLRALGPSVINLHVKDFQVHRLPHKKGFTIVGCPAGQGLLDIPNLLAVLRAMNRSPSVILEHWPPPEPTLEASIAKEEAWTSESIHYLRQLLEGNADPPPRNSQ